MIIQLSNYYSYASDRLYQLPSIVLTRAYIHLVVKVIKHAVHT